MFDEDFDARVEDERDFGMDFEDDGQPSDLTEHEDFAHDNDYDYFQYEDQHLDGMYEE